METTGGANIAGLIVSLLSCIFMLVGLGLLAFTVVNRRRAATSQSWPSVPGQVTSSSVQRNTHRDTDGDTSYTYEPRVEYTYAVEGQTYTGRRVSFGSTSSSNPRKAELTADQYKVGTPVTVYYDPSKPQDATLERKAAGSVLGIVIGIFFFLLGCCMGAGGLVIFLGDFS